MLQPGDIVTATVERAEAYGVYLRHNDDSILVLIPDCSWKWGLLDCRLHFKPGDTTLVKIDEHPGLARPIQDCNRQPDPPTQYHGSIKAARPETNPWAPLEHHNPTEPLPATVLRIITSTDNVQPLAYYVELLPDVFTYLSALGLPTLHPGDQVPVLIESVDIIGQKAKLKRYLPPGPANL